MKSRKPNNLIKLKNSYLAWYWIDFKRNTGLDWLIRYFYIKWRGSHFYRTSSNGKLAFLNNVVGVFESEIDVEGNGTEKIWEWK